METNKRHLTINSCLAIVITTLSLATFNVSALTHNNEETAANAHHLKHQNGTERNNNHQQQVKKRFKMLAKKLALNKTQRKEIKSIFAETKLVNKAHREAMSDFKEQVNVLARANEFDEEEFNVLYNSVQSNFQEIALERAKARHAVMQALTAIQRDKLGRLYEKRGFLF
jgi:Spy/CpxP family protein refolding chaperone